jgi:hypothetical protein
LFRTTTTTGLKHRYLYGLTIDSGDPQNVIVFASHSAWQAHSIEAAESFVYDLWKGRRMIRALAVRQDG